MNNYELKLARKLLNLSEAECAKYLGEDMGLKTWEFYERHHIGNYGVKPYVANKLQKLLSWRKALINNALSMVKDDIKPVVVHYDEPTFFDDFLTYKAHYSATTALNIDHGFDLIVFNKEEYQRFIEDNRLEDNSPNIARWATEKYFEIKAIQEELNAIEAVLEDKKVVLLALCEKVSFTRKESLQFIGQLTTIAKRETEAKSGELAKFLAKRLPHTMFYAENAAIKEEFTHKAQEYLDDLKRWGNVYHQTKGLIKAVDF